MSTDDGGPAANTTIRWVQNGQFISLTTDAEGAFIFRFVTPGRHRLNIEHPSIPEIGSYEALITPGESLHLAVILHRIPGNDGSTIWEIKKQEALEESPWPPERVLTASLVEASPDTGNLWSLLNHMEPSVVAERFDVSGLYSHRQLLLGVRGSSWTQNQASLNGLSVTHPSGEGTLLIPDLASMDAVTYTVGYSLAQHTGPGAHLSLLPKTGSSEPHGQTEMFFQCGALQNTNASDRYRFFQITESDERWRYFANGGFQFGGPLGQHPWYYFGAIGGREFQKHIRNQSLPVSARSGQGTFNLSGSLSAHDIVSFFGSAQRVHEPQAGASPQITREASINLIRNYYTGQGAWTRFLSGKSLLDIRFGISRQSDASRFQSDARGQSQEDLFPGYALAGLPDSPSPWTMLAMLNNTTRGPAPLAISRNSGAAQGTLVYSTVREGLHHSNHRIFTGASVRRLSLMRRPAVVDDVNLLFFEGSPNSVRLLDAPKQARDRIHQLEWYATDSFSLGRLNLTLGISVDSSQGSNLLNGEQPANILRWTNLTGRVGVAYRLLRGGRLVLRAGAAQISDQPLTSIWNAVNPDGLGVRLYSWSDTNGDLQYQAGENRQILKVSGPPYTKMDAGLKNPKTIESTLGARLEITKWMKFEFFGFHRSEPRLISLVNDGVPFTSYTSSQVSDPGFDGEVGTTDDALVTVYNQDPKTLGQDRYLLTNPPGLSAYAQGLELTLGISTRRIQAQGVVTRFRAVASTSPGIEAQQNDTSSYQGIFDNPNNAILARGSTYFDRGTLGRLQASSEFPWKIRCSLLFSYQDGMPFGRYLPVKGLNQGIIGILTEQRGSGASGSSTGPRTRYSATADVRIYRDFPLRRGSLVAILDVFNLTNHSHALEETPVTAPTQYWRIPLRFQTPRSIQLGMRYKW